ncbi:MAG TPA: L,D-transpeptidase family protein [bacterium]|nr:L,D-transpeptidase family protein [bacterium]HPO07941.1 L,D-transpeptidase family protein [bacterium]HQO33043.1 L,D-transpeptidase family protein [bacterium]HQP98074.1 L,D-transpeptidase family protein [bacterium]
MRLFLALLLIGVIVVGSIAAVFVLKEQKRSAEASQALELASAFLDQGKLEEVVQTLRPVYEGYRRFDGMDRVLFLLATAYEKTGSEHAPALWQQISVDYPESVHHSAALLAWASSVIESEPAKARELVQPLIASSDPEIAGAALAAQADTLRAEGKREEAKNLYRQIVQQYPGTRAEETALDHLSKTNMDELFAAGELNEFTMLYKVKRGDSVYKIAIDNETTKEMLMKLNNIATDLRPGQTIRIPAKKFKIVIDKSRLRLFLLTEDGQFIKWYSVAIGETDYKTPVGEYKIDGKQVDPVWYKPGGGVFPPGDPGNALGPRWISIGSHLGIHGNNDPDSIGKRASAGCIRMHNEDVLELYDIVTVGNTVSIVDQFRLGAPAQPAGEVSEATEQVNEPAK